MPEVLWLERCHGLVVRLFGVPDYSHGMGLACCHLVVGGFCFQSAEDVVLVYLVLQLAVAVQEHFLVPERELVRVLMSYI